MKVRYTKTALAEIDEIRSYIARDNPKAAAAIAAAIEKTVNRIAERRGLHRSSMKGRCVQSWWSDINTGSFTQLSAPN
jgi:plasmid stabilization system protein ParE